MTVEASVRSALVHEWVFGRTGSEKVFEELARSMSELGLAPDLYAGCVDHGMQLEIDDVVRSAWRGTSLARDHRAAALLPMAASLRQRGRQALEYDLVVTSSHSVSRWFAVGNRPARHLCYVHAPMRYAWNPEIDERLQNRWLSAAAWPARSILRSLDKYTSHSVDSFAANSLTVAARVQRFYERPSRVIYPPVRVLTPRDNVTRDGSVLSAGRFVPYKRHDLVIEACAQLGVPLVIAGSGPDRPRLRKLADASPAPVEIVDGPTDEQLAGLLARASVYANAAIEDFGILTVEALGQGTPVVGSSIGGTGEILDRPELGMVVHEHSSTAFANALRIMHHGENHDPAACRNRAADFSPASFRRDVQVWIDEDGHS